MDMVTSPTDMESPCMATATSMPSTTRATTSLMLCLVIMGIMGMLPTLTMDMLLDMPLIMAIDHVYYIFLCDLII